MDDAILEHEIRQPTISLAINLSQQLPLKKEKKRNSAIADYLKVKISKPANGFSVANVKSQPKLDENRCEEYTQNLYLIHLTNYQEQLIEEEQEETQRRE